MKPLFQLPDVWFVKLHLCHACDIVPYFVTVGEVARILSAQAGESMPIN